MIKPKLILIPLVNLLVVLFVMLLVSLDVSLMISAVIIVVFVLSTSRIIYVNRKLYATYELKVSAMMTMAISLVLLIIMFIMLLAGNTNILILLSGICMINIIQTTHYLITI